jgi:hypothetical protein
VSLPVAAVSPSRAQRHRSVSSNARGPSNIETGSGQKYSLFLCISISERVAGSYIGFEQSSADGRREDGLSCLRRFAEERRAEACDTSKKSIVKIAGAVPGCRTAEAWARLSRGGSLNPSDIALFIAIDDNPHAALRPILSVLRKHHGLVIDLVVVKNGEVVRPVGSMVMPSVR